MVRKKRKRRFIPKKREENEKYVSAERKREKNKSAPLDLD